MDFIDSDSCYSYCDGYYQTQLTSRAEELSCQHLIRVTLRNLIGVTIDDDDDDDDSKLVTHRRQIRYLNAKVYHVLFIDEKVV